MISGLFRVLVVDDISDVRNTMAGVLRDAGYFVKTAGSQSEAISVLTEENFHFIVLDIRLRGDEDEDDSGVELARTIREHGNRSKIIFVTGKSIRGSHIESVLEYGVIGYIEKNSDWADSVRRIIEKSTSAMGDDEIAQFFENAGFQIESFGKSGFIGTADKPFRRELSRVYVHLVLERTLDLDEFQSLSQISKNVFQNASSHQIAFVVIDRLPETSDLYQIFALRAQRGLTVIPLSKSEITLALRDSREVEFLNERIDLFTGQTNYYDTRTEVSELLSFFGRHTLLENIKHSLADGKSVIIFGLRKIGKSSLLARLRQDTKWPIATINLQGYSDNLDYVFVDAVSAWQRELQTMYPYLELQNWAEQIETISPSERAQIFKQAIRDFINLASSEEGFQGLFLFIDEMDSLFNQSEYYKFSGLLRSLTEEHYLKGRFALLMAGLDPEINRKDRIPSGRNPFYSFFQEYSVGPLSADDTFVMVNALGSPMGITFEDDALQMLVHAGGYHPFLTRQLCSQAIQGKIRPAIISSHHAIEAIEDYLSNPQNYMAETLWPLDIGGPPASEARILEILAIKQPCSREELFSQDDQADNLRVQELALKHLTDQYIIRKSGLDKWEITIPIFYYWIRRNILNLPITPFASANYE